MSSRACILDASLVISLGKAGHLNLLFDTPKLDLYVTPTVLGELVSPETRDPVEAAIANGRLQVLRITSDDHAELEAIAEWLELVDPGEAEAIAVALTRGWLIGLEDRAAKNFLARQGQADAVVDCVALLVGAVRSGRLIIADADAVFASLDVYSGYAKRGMTSITSFIQ